MPHTLTLNHQEKLNEWISFSSYPSSRCFFYVIFIDKYGWLIKLWLNSMKFRDNLYSDVSRSNHMRLNQLICDTSESTLPTRASCSWPSQLSQKQLSNDRSFRNHISNSLMHRTPTHHAPTLALATIDTLEHEYEFKLNIHRVRSAVPKSVSADFQTNNEWNIGVTANGSVEKCSNIGFGLIKCRYPFFFGFCHRRSFNILTWRAISRSLADFERAQDATHQLVRHTARVYLRFSFRIQFTDMCMSTPRTCTRIYVKNGRSACRKSPVRLGCRFEPWETIIYLAVQSFRIRGYWALSKIEFMIAMRAFANVLSYHRIDGRANSKQQKQINNSCHLFCFATSNYNPMISRIVFTIPLKSLEGTFHSWNRRFPIGNAICAIFVHHLRSPIHMDCTYRKDTIFFASTQNQRRIASFEKKCFSARISFGMCKTIASSLPAQLFVIQNHFRSLALAAIALGSMGC